jgi:SAM-dependent methyltransferase
VRSCPCGGGDLYDAFVWGWGVCRDCGTWVNTRRPTEDSLGVVYGEGYWGVTQEIALCPPLEQRFENDIHDRVNTYLATLLPHLPPGGHVAEIGCGNARLLHELKRRGFDVVGTEMLASTIARVARLTDVKVLRGSVELFEPESLDAVVSIDVLEHVHDPQAFLRQHARVLKRGGVMLLHTPVHEHPSEPYAYRASTLWKLYHLHLFSRTLAERLFDEAGLDVVSSDVRVFGWPLYVLRKRQG